MRRINHSQAFSLDGARTNQAESFFARLRRAEIGQHHHISGDYLGFYAAEMAWKEDNRRQANGALHNAAALAALTHPVSRVGLAIGSANSYLANLADGRQWCAASWRWYGAF